jgi:hypothetical protein
MEDEDVVRHLNSVTLCACLERHRAHTIYCDPVEDRRMTARTAQVITDQLNRVSA